MALSLRVEITVVFIAQNKNGQDKIMILFGSYPRSDLIIHFFKILNKILNSKNYKY
jgi:hypothetical protein